MNDFEVTNRLLERVKSGHADAIEPLLQSYANYLRLLARTQIGPSLRVRASESDLVQETLLEAFRDFDRFRGSSEGELVKWLRQVLAHNVANQIRHHHAQKRDLRRQRSLEDELGRSNAVLQRLLGEPPQSPSAQLIHRERSVILADLLAELPPDYREVIYLRHLEGVPFSQIADRMNRSAGAVRMLWVRALERLRKSLGDLA